MKIQEYISLSDKNWFKTGGLARYFCQPKTEQEFFAGLSFAQKQMLPLCILGQGANILISDDGFNGLVIQPYLHDIVFDYMHDTVTAGAGVCIQKLIELCLDNHMIGLEEFSGIPGSVGGAMYINIHYFQFLLQQFVLKARIIERTTGIMHDVTSDWFSFGYNTSRLLAQDHYIISTTFKLKKTDILTSMYAKGRHDEIIRHREQRYPKSNTCGSFFRNFLPTEIPFQIQGKTIPFVAYYLDKIGIKGSLSYGKAIVSYQHANMLVTQPGATSNDVIQLARTMQQMVHDTYGIIPQPECQLIGFSENPLLK